MNMLSKLRDGLEKTRKNVFGKALDIISRRKIDDETLEEIEEVLITGDVGVGTAMKIIDDVKEKIKEDGEISEENFINILKNEIVDIISLDKTEENIISAKPYVIMIVGVNGTGKTTTIGKLAYRYRQENKKVLLAAADTFRAAAVEQLEIWKKRAGTDIIKNVQGTDPASVAYDSLQAAISRDIDVLIIDTAGRLHTKSNLMNELKKIKRVLKKLMPDAPHETLLILDANTGQNAISQAKVFMNSIEIDGIILTKLDGTAKGGVVISIVNQLNIPIKYIGIGEKIEDIEPFNPQKFTEALIG